MERDKVEKLVMLMVTDLHPGFRYVMSVLMLATAILSMIALLFVLVLVVLIPLAIAAQAMGIPFCL